MTLSVPCISFARSLDLLNIDNKAGAYGYLDPEHYRCDVSWSVYQREGWIRALAQAQAEIERDLGAPLCPRQICGEQHAVASSIRLRQAPVAYLGEKTYGDWTEVALEGAGTTRYVEICETDLSEGLGVDNIEFSYPDAALATYSGEQALQAPIVAETSDCNGTGEDGWRFTWQVYQVVEPDEDTVQVTDTDGLLEVVKWRTYTIDSSAAYEVVGYCGCTTCQNEDPLYTLSLCDETDGLVCIEEPFTKCTNRDRQIRLSYGAAFNCEGEIAADLERAVVLLALVKAQHTPSKPCGCDNSFIEQMLEIDPSMKFDFATKLRYGFTKAGMEVMHILNKYKERPHFNTTVTSGGLLTARKKNRRNRYEL